MEYGVLLVMYSVCYYVSVCVCGMYYSLFLTPSWCLFREWGVEWVSLVPLSLVSEGS